MHVAYIVSMPYGMDKWSFQELEGLSEHNIDVTVFPLKYAIGPYMPKEGWGLYVLSKWQLALRQPLWLLRFPIRYVTLLIEAILNRSVVDFFLGFDFAGQMARRGQTGG